MRIRIPMQRNEEHMAWQLEHDLHEARVEILQVFVYS